MFTVKRSVRKSNKKATEGESVDGTESRPLTQSNMNSNNSVRMFRSKKDISKRSGGLINTNYMSHSTNIAKPPVQTESEEKITSGPLELLEICERND